jgi:transposase
LRMMVLMPKRYPPEVREKAFRLALDRLDEYGSAYAAAHRDRPAGRCAP